MMPLSASTVAELEMCFAMSSVAISSWKASFITTAHTEVSRQLQSDQNVSVVRVPSDPIAFSAAESTASGNCASAIAATTTTPPTNTRYKRETPQSRP